MLRITYFTVVESDLLPLSKSVNFIKEKWGDIVDVNLILPDTLMNSDLMLKAKEKAMKSHLIILHLHGGETSFPYYNEFIKLAKKNNIDTCIFDYGYEPRPDLVKSSTMEFEGYRNVFKYIVFSGEKNYKNLLLYLIAYYKIKEVRYEEPEKPPQFGIYHPKLDYLPTLQEYMNKFCNPDKLTIGILFHQRDWVTKNLDFVDRIIRGIEMMGANALACFEAVGSSTEDSKRDIAWFFKNYFVLNGKAVVNCILSLLFFSLCSIQNSNPTYVEDMERDSDENFKRTWFLRKLNVPIIKVINTLNDLSQWKESKLGLNPMDIMWSVALPEFDGAIITVPVCSKERSEYDRRTGLRVTRYMPIPERTDKAIRLAINWGKLSSIANKDKKVAIIFHNYPPRNDQIASAFGLDSTQSVTDLMKAMKSKGYKLDYIPETGDELINKILECATNDLRWDSEEEILEKAVDTISSKDAEKFFKYIPDESKLAIEKDWSRPPGKVMVLKDEMLIQGIINGNVFIGMQPRRGFLDDPAKIYHDPDMTPPWQYLGYYRWIRDVFKADAVMHIGKHGSLEWLPGKAIGLSKNCYPDLAIMDLPNIYPYIINNPSEGTQAKRRSYACIIDHLIPVMNNADSYGEMEELEVLLDDYYHVKTQDTKKLISQQKVIWEKTTSAKLDTDLKITQKEAFADFDKFLEKLHGYISEMKDTLIRDGLHIMGQPPAGESLKEMFASLTRLANGSVPSIRASVAKLLGMDYDDLLENRGKFNKKFGKPNAVLLDEINVKIAKLIDEYGREGYNPQNAEDVMEKVFHEKSSDLKKVLIYIGEILVEKLSRTTEEFDACMSALNGGYTPPGPSGAPTRGCADILPTGRNFYSIDPQGVPSRAAYKVGKKLAEELIKRFVDEEGHYPESIGMIIWGGGVMRTKGDDIAEIFNLIGVKPEWEDKSGRVVGFEIIPLEELGRPRIDFTIREGGLRDAFPNIIYLINNAVEAVIELDEPDDMNFVRKHFRKTYDECVKKKISLDESKEIASARVFGSKPGTYGAGVSDLIDAQNWENDEDIANVYVTWGAYAYSEKSYGKFIPEVFRERLSQMEIVVKNEDTREYDFLDGDDFYSYHGGMIASVRAITGKDPHAYSCDTSDPDRIQVRTIQEEAKHIFRARILNPKWIESMKRHGFKGAGDFSRMVDIAFGWDATGHALEDWMYEELANTYALDKDMQDFFKRHNPYALHNIAERLLEAIEREMWNTSEEMKDNLREIMMEVEGDLE